MTMFINIDGTLINLDNVSSVELSGYTTTSYERDIIGEYMPNDKYHKAYRFTFVSGAEQYFDITNDNASQAYIWLTKSCIATFTDDSAIPMPKKGVSKNSEINPDLGW